MVPSNKYWSKIVESKLILDLSRTLVKMSNKQNTVSWSRLSDFNNCPASCFIKHYAVFSESASVTQDFTKALAGSIIQKIMEVFINNRIYLRPEMKSLEDLVKWCQLQFRCLYYTMAFDLEYQHRAEFKIKNGYYSSKKGKETLSEQYLRGLDIAFQKVEVCFINRENLFLFYGSEENFLIQHEKIMGPILESFLYEKIDLNKVISEQKVECTINKNINMLGFVDFIFNKYGMEWELFDKIGKLKNYYVLLDGKYKVANYTDKDQLFFYASMIYMKYKCLPEWVAFVDWNKGKFTKYAFDPTHIQLVQQQVYAYTQIIGNIHRQIENIKIKNLAGYILLEELDSMDYIPSHGNCLFCPVRTCCESALDKGCTGVPKGVLKKAATMEHLNSLELDESIGVHDITL